MRRDRRRLGERRGAPQRGGGEHRRKARHERRRCGRCWSRGSRRGRGGSRRRLGRGGLGLGVLHGRQGGGLVEARRDLVEGLKLLDAEVGAEVSARAHAEDGPVPAYDVAHALALRVRELLLALAAVEDEIELEQGFQAPGSGQLGEKIGHLIVRDGGLGDLVPDLAVLAELIAVVREKVSGELVERRDLGVIGRRGDGGCGSAQGQQCGQRQDDAGDHSWGKYAAG